MYRKILLPLLTASFILAGCSQFTAMRVSNQLKLANNYLVSAEYDEAIFALQKAIQIDPKNVDAYILLADTFSKVGRVDEAKYTLDKAKEIQGITEDKLSQIVEKLDSLDFLVGFSLISGEYPNSVSIVLSNPKNYDIIYSLETDNSRLAANEARYISPIILDDDGVYNLSSYCIDDDGTKHNISIAKYVINLNRDMYTNNSWKLTDGTYRYRGADGTILTGWQQIDDAWYYLADNGDMATGWQQIGDIWYHFNDNGIMTTDATIDGYSIGADGIITGVDSNNNEYKNIFKDIYKDALTTIYDTHKLNEVSWDGSDSQYLRFVLTDANGDFVDDLLVYGGINYGTFGLFTVYDGKLTTMFSAKNVVGFSPTIQSVLELEQVDGDKHSLSYIQYDKNSHKFSTVLFNNYFENEIAVSYAMARLREELGGLIFSPATLHESLTIENIGTIFN